MKEFTPKWIAKARERMKHISPLPWKACSCGKCGMITGEKDLIATATRGDWGDDYPIIKPVGGSIGGQYEVVMEQITYGHVPPETGNINAQYIAEACNNYPEALDESERLQDLMLAYENDLVLLSVYGKLKRAEERIAELEQERWWIPVREYPSQQGWYRVIINDGTEKVRFYKRDTENDREYWHVANNKEWIMMWTNPCLPQEPKEEE